MKRALFMLLAVSMVAVLTGCCRDYVCCGTNGGMTGLIRGSCANCPDVCRRCGPACRGGRDCEEVFDPGPPTGAITYPYYTVRGPRDFLAEYPRPIGP